MCNFGNMKRLLTICLTLIFHVAMLSAQRDSVAHITHFSEADGYSQSIVGHALQDRQGYVWLCTWNGLLRYDGYRFCNYKMRPGDGSPLRTNRISTVEELEDGNLLCSTTDSMFCLFHRQTGLFEQTTGDYAKRPRPYKASAHVEEKVKSLTEFSNVFTRILLVDRQGGIWVDTHSGLYRIWFTRSQLKPLKFGQEAEEEVRCLYSDRQGRTWVADKNGYVRVFAHRWSQPLYLTPQGSLTTAAARFGERIYCIYEDSQQHLWLGCKPGGLLKLTAAGGGYSITRYLHQPNDPYSISSNSIYAIAEDDRQRLWIAAFKGGLNMLDLRTGRDIFVNSHSGLTGWDSQEERDKVRSLCIIGKQVLVAGTLDGLVTANIAEEPQKMTFRHYERNATDATSLSNNWVMALQPLPDGRLAIATTGGGICFAEQQSLLSDSLKFSSIMTDGGLASDVCESMLYVPADSSLYIVSQTAISRMTLHGGSITNYMRGTLADNFNLLETPPLLTADRHLLLGTTQGVLDIKPDDLQKSSYRPTIVFECDTLISLSPDERSLTISFAAIDYNKSVPITYAYRIEGMNDQWNYINDNRITLPDIPAGTYRLHLRSTNGDGIWTDNERVLTITRKAAFYETLYFWLLAGCLLALTITAVLQVVRYIRRLQKEIKDVRLTSNQRIEVMSDRIRELLSIREKVEPVTVEQVDIENEEDRRFAERVKTYIATNLADSNLSVYDFAREMGVSRTILFARMKSVFGTSPNNYLLNQRVERAKELLRQPGAYIADVAYRSGFADPKYFSKCFKKLVGMTPTEFQKQ